MYIYSDGRIYDGEPDREAMDSVEEGAFDSSVIYIADDSAEAEAIRAGGTVTINDFGAEDFTVTPAPLSAVETALASLQTRFDNSDLEEADLPDFFTVMNEMWTILNRT